MCWGARECSTGNIDLNYPRAGSKKWKIFGTILARTCGRADSVTRKGRGHERRLLSLRKAHNQRICRKPFFRHCVKFSKESKATAEPLLHQHQFICLYVSLYMEGILERNFPVVIWFSWWDKVTKPQLPVYYVASFNFLSAFSKGMHLVSGLFSVGNPQLPWPSAWNMPPLNFW